MSQLLTVGLDTEDGECFNKLFVSLHKSQLLTADVLIKVSCLLTSSLTLYIVSLGFPSGDGGQDVRFQIC